MARALELAWRGWGRVAPNPMVGAVVLRGRRGRWARVARGVRGPPRRGGGPGEAGCRRSRGDARGHPRALRASGEAAALHRGACSRRASGAWSRRWRIPIRSRGGGAARLRAAGVEVEVGLVGARRRRQNATVPAPRSASRRGRSWRSSSPPRWMGASPIATGTLALDQRAGGARLGALAARRVRRASRWAARTARVDDPSLTVRGTVAPRRRRVRVVFARRAELPTALALVRTAREVPDHGCSRHRARRARAAALGAAGVDVRPATDLAAALGALRARRGRSAPGRGRRAAGGRAARRGPGGPATTGCRAPLWLGAGGVPAVAGPRRALPLAEAARWRVVERRAAGGGHPAGGGPRA